MKTYELVWILPGNAARDVIDASVEKINALIADAGGKILQSGFWDQRTLAYPIKKNEVGAYCLAQFEIAPDKVSELSDAVRIDASILRHLISKIDRVNA